MHYHVDQSFQPFFTSTRSRCYSHCSIAIVTVPTPLISAMKLTSNSRQSPRERCILLFLVVLAFGMFYLLALDRFWLRTRPFFSKEYETLNRTNEAQREPVPSAAPLPLCSRKGKRARTFLMMFMGHSGSTSIISELFSHSQIYTEGSGEPVDHGDQQNNSTFALQWTREFFKRGIAAGKIPGFKIRPTHIQTDPKAWAALVREFDTRVIWQYRENLFKKAVGEYTKRYLNDTSVVEGLERNMTYEQRCKVGAGCRFQINDLPAFHSVLQHLVRNDKDISTGLHLMLDGRKCVYPVPYENYLYSRTTTMRNLQDFLGIQHEMHEPSHHKATSDNMCETVLNWDEICTNFYACHSWRLMMDDPRNNCYCNFTSGPVKYCAADMR